MKRKQVQKMAHELADAIDDMRREMAMQDATIQRQTLMIKELREALEQESDVQLPFTDEELEKLRHVCDYSQNPDVVWLRLAINYIDKLTDTIQGT